MEIKRIKLQNIKMIDVLFFQIVENSEHVPLHILLNVIGAKLFFHSFLEQMKFVNLGIIYSFGNLRLIFHSFLFSEKVGTIGKKTEIYPYSHLKTEKFAHSNDLNHFVLKINSMNKLSNFKIITINVQSDNPFITRIFSRTLSSLLSAKLCIYSTDSIDLSFIEKNPVDDCVVYLLKEYDENNSEISSLNYKAFIKSIIDKLSKTSKELNVILLPSNLNQRLDWICCDLTFVLDDKDSITRKNGYLTRTFEGSSDQTKNHKPLQVDTKWSSIGGLEDVKKILKESILDPIEVIYYYLFS